MQFQFTIHPNSHFTLPNRDSKRVDVRHLQISWKNISKSSPNIVKLHPNAKKLSAIRRE